ncbi:MAG: cytochrome c-type biogenesis CcmF C-terminal domain-containing protein, partial [Brevundimonas sp.]
WTLRIYHNPWARLIFLGPAIMALGGVLSLMDRRLRLAMPGRRKKPLPLEGGEVGVGVDAR